jgi:hypothetical protein
MTTPKDDPAIQEAWVAVRNHRMNEEGASLRQVTLELAEAYGCRPETVRLYLDPAYRTRHRDAGRRSQRRLYTRRKRQRIHNRNYHRLTRPGSQARLLAQVFDSRMDVVLTLDQITQSVRPLLEGVPFKSWTVENRLLAPYMEGQESGRIRGPPYLARVATGYQLRALPPSQTGDHVESRLEGRSLMGHPSNHPVAD